MPHEVETRFPRLSVPRFEAAFGLAITADLYAHVGVDLLRDAANAMERVLGEPPG